MNALMSAGFRPFFLATALHAVVAIGAWALFLAGVMPLATSRPILWHAHEMLFGFVPAAIAGFLLTASPHWTGTPPPGPRVLGVLVLLWLAGRLTFWTIDPFTASNTALAARTIAAAFLPALALTIGLRIVRSGNHRNLGVAAVLIALSIAQLLFLAGGHHVRAQTLALDLVLVLMTIIGGRITPLFTRNWLLGRGQSAHDLGADPWLDRAAVGLTVAVLVLNQLDVPLCWVAVCALAAGLAHFARLAAWQGLRAWRDPLVAVLHLGYAWIGATLLLRSVALLVPTLPNRAWVHAAAVGAIGTLIIGVIPRVTLGHTGRALRLPRGAWLAFAAITAAAVLRIGVAIGLVPDTPGLRGSAVAWAAGFMLFAVYFLPMWFTPRVDAERQ